MSFYNWYNHLSQEGKKYGYLVNGSKSWLTVKSGVLTDEAKRVFEMRSMLQMKVRATPSSDLKSSKIKIVGKKSFDAKENSKHYLR